MRIIKALGIALLSVLVLGYASTAIALFVVFFLRDDCSYAIAACQMVFLPVFVYTFVRELRKTQ